MRIVGSKKRENAESLAEAHTVCLYHERETKYYRLDTKGTGKYWILFSPHFLCSINHQWPHENRWCSQEQLTCIKPLISVAGPDVLLAQRLLQNSRKETCRLFPAPSYGHLGFNFPMTKGTYSVLKWNSVEKTNEQTKAMRNPLLFLK